MTHRLYGNHLAGSSKKHWTEPSPHTSPTEVRSSEPKPPLKGQMWFDTSGSTGIGGVVAITTKTTNYTATHADTVILCDATAGAFTITLPTTVGIKGKVYYIKKIDVTANAVTIDPDGTETIDDNLTLDLAFQYDSPMIVGDNTNWWIL